MSRQTYFIGPKFNKKSIYNSSVNKYQEFTNAYVYSTMVKTGIVLQIVLLFAVKQQQNGQKLKVKVLQKLTI